METYDFCGWATKNDLRCSDGRIIRHNAFKGNDGEKVPLVWSHDHDDPDKVLGHAVLENREEGVYCYGKFNDTSSGQISKVLVEHGDINSLSIYANQLKQINSDVVHGNILEVSLVYAGANPGASIETVLAHSEDYDEEAIIYTGEEITYLSHSDNGNDKPDADDKEKKEKTIGEIFESMTDEQKNAVYAIVEQALIDEDVDDKDDEENKEKDKEEKKTMKHNVFDSSTSTDNTLSHSDKEEIIKMAKSSTVGSLQAAIDIYASQHDSIAHGFNDIDILFPDYKDVHAGAPELIQRDQGWVSVVMAKTHKSPISRLRTRQIDVRNEEIRAKGYEKGKEKKVPSNGQFT